MNATNQTLELGINFLSVDKKIALSSYGQYFKVNELVENEDRKAGKATILSFSIDESSNEVLVETSKGSAHLDFLVKID